MTTIVAAGHALVGTENPVRAVVRWLIDVSELPVLVYFAAINTTMLILILLAASEFTHHLRRMDIDGREELVGSRVAPGVSVVVPMYNEQAGIATSVQSLLSLRYPRHEVVVVDDGSADDSFAVLEAAFDLVAVPRAVSHDIAMEQPVESVHVPRNGRTRLTVLRKQNSGRSDSVNAGVNAAVEELVVFVDADSVLEADSLLAVTKPFADDPVRTVATGGVIRPANGCRITAGRVVEVRLARSWLARIQVVEYLRAFYLGRAGWSRVNALILISGAFGVFRRDAIVTAGGLDPRSIGEDFELVMRLHRELRRQRRDYRVRFVAEPVCWTEVPTSLRVLQRQRSRWHRGLWETLWKYRGSFLNPRQGRVGMVAIPFYWIFELIAPLLEVIGLVIMIGGFAFGLINLPTALLFLAVAYGYAIVVTLAAILIEELSFHRYGRWRDLGLIAAAAVAENVGYRQLTVLWRLQGWAASLARRRQVWGTMTRTGFAPATSAPGLASPDSDADAGVARRSP